MSLDTPGWKVAASGLLVAGAVRVGNEAGVGLTPAMLPNAPRSRQDPLTFVHFLPIIHRGLLRRVWWEAWTECESPLHLVLRLFVPEFNAS